MAKKKKVTLHDIADKTGFSITTISHVINKTRHVESETRRIIQKAVDELGYSPQRKTVSNGNLIIGVITADIRVDFFYEIIKEIELVARNLGYNLIFCDSEESVETEKDCIEMLLKRDVAGIILAPCDVNSDYSYLKEKHRMPVVLIDRDFKKRMFDFVGIDNFKSAYLAIQELIQSNVKRIAYIGFNDSLYCEVERKSGYKAAICEAGLFDQNLILGLEHHTEGMKYGIYDFLENNPDIEAILCINSNICYETLWSLEELGITNENGPVIISYDDNKWFDQLKYPVTSIKQPTGDIATVATEMLIDKIVKKKKTGSPKLIFLNYEFIRRS